jgi:uncharacterized membrane-anchored protein YitT (DUF2179 family)
LGRQGLGTPPFRYYLGCILIGAEIVEVEKASHIASGGVGGLSIALFAFSHWPVGFWNLAVKVVLFLLVWFIGGRWVALWTAVSAGLVGGSALALELIPWQPHWATGVAFLVIMTVGYLPTGLVMSRGYSSGGFTALAVTLQDVRRIPVWLTLTVLNASAVTLMAMAYGRWAGVLSLAATAWQAPAIALWTRWVGRVLDGNRRETG